MAKPHTSSPTSVLPGIAELCLPDNKVLVYLCREQILSINSRWPNFIRDWLFNKVAVYLCCLNYKGPVALPWPRLAALKSEFEGVLQMPDKVSVYLCREQILSINSRWPNFIRDWLFNNKVAVYLCCLDYKGPVALPWLRLASSKGFSKCRSF